MKERRIKERRDELAFLKSEKEKEDRAERVQARGVQSGIPVLERNLRELKTLPGVCHIRHKSLMLSYRNRYTDSTSYSLCSYVMKLVLFILNVLYLMGVL